MSIVEISAVLALTGRAVYKQTVVAEVASTNARFRPAGIYAGIGVLIGGFHLPDGWQGWVMIGVGLSLSFVVGVLRGRHTRIWVADGKVWRRGTALTVGLFLGLIAAKFALGTVAYFFDIDDGAGFGEVLVMIAIMIAVQAQIVHARAVHLTSTTSGEGRPATSDSPLTRSN